MGLVLNLKGATLLDVVIIQKRGEVKMMKVALMAFVVLSLVNCASQNQLPPENLYKPVPDKFGIYNVRGWNNGTMVYGQIIAVNLTSRQMSGVVSCEWKLPTGKVVNHDFQDFDLPAGEKRLLEFSTLAEFGGRARMRLTCEITYLVCNDCGNKVIINK